MKGRTALHLGGTVAFAIGAVGAGSGHAEFVVGLVFGMLLAVLVGVQVLRSLGIR